MSWKKIIVDELKDVLSRAITGSVYACKETYNYVMYRLVKWKMIIFGRMNLKGQTILKF